MPNYLPYWYSCPRKIKIRYGGRPYYEVSIVNRKLDKIRNWLIVLISSILKLIVTGAPSDLIEKSFDKSFKFIHQNVNFMG